MEEDHVVGQYVAYDFNLEDHVDSQHVTGIITMEDHGDRHHVTNIIAMQQQFEDPGPIGELNQTNRQNHEMIDIKELFND